MIYSIDSPEEFLLVHKTCRMALRGTVARGAADCTDSSGYDC